MTRWFKIKVTSLNIRHLNRQVLWLLLSVGLTLSGRGSAEPAVDQQKFVGVQAAYIFNLARFVEWPPMHGSSFQICLLGEAQQVLARQLQLGTKDKKIQTLPIDILVVDPAETTVEIAAEHFNQCRVLYLADDPDSSNWKFLPQLNQPHILRIGSPKLGSNRYSQVDLVFEKGRILLYLNSESLLHSGLQVNPALLSIARQRTKS